MSISKLCFCSTLEVIQYALNESMQTLHWCDENSHYQNSNRNTLANKNLSHISLWVKHNMKSSEISVDLRFTRKLINDIWYFYWDKVNIKVWLCLYCKSFVLMKKNPTTYLISQWTHFKPGDFFELNGRADHIYTIWDKFLDSKEEKKPCTSLK